jgi:hypothetical protein
MGCELKTEQYIPIVKNLVTLNPSVYTSYDAVAKFILEADLLPEQKKLALHNIAHIYNGLFGLDDKMYTLGKAVDVINSVGLFDDTEGYLANAYSLYDLKKQKGTTFESVVSAIDALAKQSLITVSDLTNAISGPLAILKQYIATNVFDTIEDQTAAIDQLRGALKDVISNMAKADEGYKKVLYDTIDDFVQTLEKKSNYIPIQDIQEMTGLDNILIVLSNGTMVEAALIDEVLYTYDKDGMLVEIPTDQIVAQKSARPADWSDSNDGKQVFREDAFISGLTIDSINPEEHDQVLNELNKMASPSSGIKISAVRLSDIGDARVQRMKQLAADDPQYAGLANRDYETFENSTQVEYLKANPEGKVLTVSRPKASQSDYAIVGEIIATGSKFYIYSMDNFVFVSADNKTEKLDLANPGHLKLLQDLSLKRIAGGTSELENSDISTIVEAQKLFKNFQEKIKDKVATAFQNESSVDVTDEFLQMYDLTSQRQSAPTKTILKDAVAKNPQLSKRLTVVELDPAGKVISQETRLIPFYYVKLIDYKSKTITYQQVPFLAGSERIMVELPNGDVKYVTEQVYANEVLNLQPQIEKIFEKEDSNLKELLKNNQTLVGVPKTLHFIMRFKADGSMSYAGADPVRQLENPEFFAKFIATMSQALSAQGQSKASSLKQLQNNNYQLEPLSISGKGFVLTFDFATSPAATGSLLQLEVRPYGIKRDSRYGEVILNSKNSFNFRISELEINNIAKSLTDSPLINKVFEEVPALRKYDLSKPEQLVDFYSDVFEISALPTESDAIKKLAQLVQEQQAKFTDLILKSTIGIIQKNPDGLFTDFLDLLKEDLTTADGEFIPEAMFVVNNEDGSQTLKVKSPNSSASTTKSAFNKSMKNIKIVESASRRSFKIVSKAPINQTPSDKDVENLALTQAQKEIVDEVGAAENGALKIDPSNPISGPIQLRETGEQVEDEEDDAIDLTDIPFSIVDGAIQFATDEDLLTESQWLLENLPQFGLDRSSLPDLIDLTKIDGTVLGAFKDRMIYLNSALPSKGTLYHEAFHGVFRYLLTPSERKALIQETMNNPKHASKFTAKAVEEFARVRNLSATNYDTLVELIAEEILADGFQAYMAKAKPAKAKTAMQRLFEMLKKLLNMFVKKQTEIEQVYDRVKTGYYKTATIKSDIYNGQVAFEIIPGPIKYYSDVEGNVIKSQSAVTVAEQNQLINMMVGVMFQDGVQSDTFDVKFERATSKLLSEIYSMEKLVAQNPEKKDMIESKYGSLISTYRFILGARTQGLAVNDINLSGNTKYDNRQGQNDINLINGERVDNTLGQYSYDLLKKLTKEKYDKANSIKIQRDNDEFTLDAEEVENTFSGENSNEIEDEDQKSVREELESNNFDEGLGEQNRMDSYVAQLRRFLSTLRSDVYDAELGINVPRMIDGEYLFPTLLKITAAVDPKYIVDTIGAMAKQMQKDGFVQTGTDLEIVYNEIKTKTKADAQGVAQTNKQLVNLLTEVLHGVELNYLMFNIATPKKINMEEASSSAEIIEAGREQFVNFRLYDKVIDADITKKRNDIIAAFIKKHSSNASQEEFKQAVEYLINFSKQFMSQPDILSSLAGQTIRLQQLSDEIHNAMQTIGLNIPRSLVELSLLGINKAENNVALDVDPEVEMFYNVNENFIKQEQFLEKDFFRSLSEVLKSAYLDNGAPNSRLRNILDDEKTKNKDATRMLLILKKASAYIVKYDPTDIPSVIKNAEGKSIYRFAKYNPLMLLAQRLNTMTLDEALSDDPYYENTLKSFMQNNAFFGGILKGEEGTEKMQLFLKNFTVAMFGGVQQRIGDVVKKGQTFKNVDERSLHMLQLLAFMNKKTVSDKLGNMISTYFRSFHQLESTSTNFLISSLYEQFISKDPKAGTANAKGQAVITRGKKQYLKIVEDLEAVIKQEYARISREWSRRLDLKDNYEAGTSNELVNKYNATLEEDGVTPNVDSTKLRAYNFQILYDFFENESDIADTLIQLAKDQVAFEDIEADELLAALNDYAQKEFQTYLDKLENLGLISKSEIPEAGRFADPRPGVTKITEYYDSEMLPKKITSNFTSAEIKEIYPQPEGALKTAGLDPVESLLFDMFMNNWRNGLHVNQLMDGDMALNVKNAQDYVKRLKKIVASGSNMKSGTHKVSYMDAITAFVHELYPQYGPYYDRSEIKADFTIPSEELRETLLDGYDKAVAGVKDIENGQTLNYGDMMREVFDGQSISSLMHQMEMHDTLGRLDDRSLYILIAKHYRALTEDETRYLESMKIVNNAKKTVTAGRNTYHKQSEGYIDRNDVSILNIEPGENETLAEATARVYDELHGLYMSIYDLRKDREDIAEFDSNNTSEINNINTQISELYQKIHNYYVAMPHREMLHDLLNAMEFFQVDQIMDTTASKNATLLPVNIFKADRTGLGYINLGLASIDVPNSAKYLQVETSGVKDKAKHSVQAKLLLPANISELEFAKIIELESKKMGRSVTPSELEAMANLKTALNDYQLSLKSATNARLIYFKDVLRKGNDFDLGKMFTMIRESLQEQNAPKNILDMFAVKPDGKPVFSPNLSLVRQTLEYYMIAQYSKNVTDEKVSGFKSFHESSFGYNVMVDTLTGDVVTTQQIGENPDQYKDKARYKSRPLSVTTEVQEDGSTLYFAEVIVPKPYFENAQQELFYMENLRKMFATRIPTEDKRSMVALKVVDFVDSSKLNNIIVPHFVHMLSGSDFDIDSLFGRMMSYYKNGKNEYAMYGDYSQYETPEMGEYIEFLHFMAKHEDFAPAIRRRKQELRDMGGEGTLELPSDGALFQILRGLKIDLANVTENFDQKFIKSKYSDEKDFTSYMFQLTKESKDFYVKAKELADQNPENRELAKTRNVYGKELADLKAIRQAAVTAQQKTKQQLTFLDNVFEYQAILDVMSAYGLPASLEAFMNNENFSQMVSPKYQNANLTASLQILGNEAVFNYLYINQRASTQQFKDILESFGIDLDTITKKSNLFTPTAMIESKVENNMNKDGIGRTAVMNKFLSLASQYNLKLSDRALVWVYANADGSVVFKDTFGQLNEKDQRVISIIGNILGMFADGAKDPIPAALQMNEVNASTTLAMIGIGLDPEFALAFNFLPEVRNAALAVQQSQFAVSEDLDQEYLFYNQAIVTQLQELVTEDESVLNRLKQNGVITKTSWPGRIVFDKPINVKIGFEPKKLNIYSLKNNLLTPSSIGFEMRFAGTDEMLTEDEMKVVLLSYYGKQAQQTWSINRAASMTNLFKRLNPSLVAFDKMRDNIEELMDPDRSMFDEASIGKLFGSDQVWNTLSDALEDANEQFSKVFLERTPFFNPITRIFKGYFEDPKTVANTLTSFLALGKFKLTYPGSRKVANPVVQSIIDNDDAMILKSFTPEYWFTNNLYEQVEKLREKYPDNDFLKLLRPDKSDSTATVIYNGTSYAGVTERFVTMLSKAKIKGEYANKVTDDISFLYNQGTVEEKQFVKNLFYHELVRTGMQYKQGSFISYMPAELKIPVSNYIEEFIDGIKSMEGSKTFEEDFTAFIKQYTGETTEEGVSQFFTEMFNQLAYAANAENNNRKIPQFRDKKNAVSISFKFNSKNPNFSKPIVKAFVEKEANKETLPVAKLKAMNYVLGALGLSFDSSVDLTKIDSIRIAEALGDDFTINLSERRDGTEKAAMILGGMFGIKRNMQERESLEFVFPSIMKVAGKTYVLQGVDDNAKGNKTIGSNLFDAIVGKTSFSNTGNVAKYKVIPAQYTSDALSPIAFSSEDAEKYKRYITKKEAIIYNVNVVDTSKGETQGTNTNDETKKPEETKKPTSNTIVTGGTISKGQLEGAAQDEVEGIGSEAGATASQISIGDDALLNYLNGLQGEQGPQVPQLQRGRYVTYKGSTYIVTQQNANGTWQIYNPLLEGSAAKISVSEANLTPLDLLAKIVEFKETEYIVTPKNTIISLKTNKRMEWDENDGNRKLILGLASQNRTIIKPNNRPSIDPTDENNC